MFQTVYILNLNNVCGAATMSIAIFCSFSVISVWASFTCFYREVEEGLSLCVYLNMLFNFYSMLTALLHFLLYLMWNILLLHLWDVVLGLAFCTIPQFFV